MVWRRGAGRHARLLWQKKAAQRAVDATADSTLFSRSKCYGLRRHYSYATNHFPDHSDCYLWLRAADGHFFSHYGFAQYGCTPSLPVPPLAAVHGAGWRALLLQEKDAVCIAVHAAIRELDRNESRHWLRKAECC